MASLRLGYHGTFAGPTEHSRNTRGANVPLVTCCRHAFCVKYGTGGVLEIIRPLDRDEARAGEALRLALLLSALVSGLLLGGSMLVVWAGRRRSRPGSDRESVGE